MAAVLNGGLALRWVCDTLNASWPELYSSAERRPERDDPLFLPHLNGERTPYLDASMRGAWTGLTPRHTRSDLLRSALEGVAFAAAEALEALFPDGRGVDHLRLAGGGTAAPAWRQMLADVLDVELAAVAVPGRLGTRCGVPGRPGGRADGRVRARGAGDSGGHLAGRPDPDAASATATDGPGSETRSSTCGRRTSPCRVLA